VQFARDVAVSFAANEVSALLGRDEVDRLRRRLDALQEQVRNHYESAPMSQYHEALKILQVSKARIDTIEARLSAVELKVEALDERLKKVETNATAALEEDLPGMVVPSSGVTPSAIAMSSIASSRRRISRSSRRQRLPECPRCPPEQGAL
jgi:hypothetical protein